MFGHKGEVITYRFDKQALELFERPGLEFFDM